MSRVVTPIPIADQLRAALPPTLHVLVPDVAELLTSVQSGAMSETQARTLLNSTGLLDLLRTLAGPAIQVGSISNSLGVAIGANARAEVRIFQGPGYPRPDYSGEIATRLADYEKVFVGRDALLQQIMQVTAISDSGYVLIEANAGFGKSAVSAQLIRRYKHGMWAGPTPMLLYFFIRQESAEHTPIFCLQRINAQLLELLQVEGGVPGDLDSLRSQFSQLWSAAVQQARANHPLLLIVDGLDEMAAGDVTIATLLPDNLSPWVHVLVTSRPNPDVRGQVASVHPLQQAICYELVSFTLDDIAQLLRASGLDPAKIPTLAPAVLEITRGEPLFARFVCQEVAAAGALPAELASQPPNNVATYFKNQFKLLDKAVGGGLARSILGVLAIARAGLTPDELAAILDHEPYEITSAIGLIERFLIGDDRYELMHLELRRSVSASFSAKRREAFRNQLLTWCASFEGRWAGAVPIYVLEQYARHLAERGDHTALYRLVTDPAFRAAQRRQLGDIGATLNDLRMALDTALEYDQIGHAIACAGAYRETLRHGRLSETIFEAIDAADDRLLLRRAAICGTDSDWAHVLWGYIAWEAAITGKVDLVQRALAALSGAATPPLSDLCDALLVRTAYALDGIDGLDTHGWLAAWGRGADAQTLTQRYCIATPVDLQVEAQRLNDLEGMAQQLTSRAAIDARSGLYELVTTLEHGNEENAAHISGLRADLVRYAAHPEGREVIAQMIAATLPNPYPYYRNHGLATLGVAALAAPDDADNEGRGSWIRRQMRAMLAVALYGEGVTFTFDLPAMLLALPHPPSDEAVELEGMVMRGAGLVDRWGTHLRAGSAIAIARCRRNPMTRDSVVTELRDRLDRPLGYAGYATLNLLAVVNACIELGIELEHVPVAFEGKTLGILDQAESAAGHVRDQTFRLGRLVLVQTLRTEWLSKAVPDIAQVHTRLARMPDRDRRLAYIAHLSARWSARGATDWPALKQLVVLALSDATTLDMVLARLVGVWAHALTPEEVTTSIVACARDLATGRPWEYGVGTPTAHIEP